MRVLSIVNYKGGSAKSTTAVSLAESFARLIPDKRILLVDTDEQGNSSSVFLAGGVSGGNAKGVAELFGEALYLKKDLVQTTRFDNIDVIPPGPNLPGKQMPGGKVPSGALVRVRQYLEALEYDYVVIDCPPARSALAALAALYSSHYVIIPVKMGRWYLQGIAPMLEILKSLRSRDLPIKLLGILPCAIDFRYKTHKESLKILRSKFSKFLTGDIQIRTSSALANSLDEGRTPHEGAPYNIATKQYEKLATWCLSRMGEEL